MEKRNNGADWLKWVAIGLMCVDHLKWINIQNPNGVWLEILGRPVFPLFAILVGWNLANNTKNPANYVARILIAAAIMCGLESGLKLPTYGQIHQLNAFATLGIGALFTQALLDFNQANNLSTFRKTLQIVLATAILIKFAPHCEYGIAGMLIITLTAVLVPRTKLQRVPITTLGLILNPHWIYALPTTLALWFGLQVLNSPKIKPCPLPNSKWLYLALPLSYLPAWVWQLTQK